MIRPSAKYTPKSRGKPESVRTAGIQEGLLRWFATNGRDFPWRKTDNAFHVLIAEVLLRQTQAERVVGPYLELVAHYPNPPALAKADVNQLRQWFKPLGLLRRADHLVLTATKLTADYAGQVPNDLDAILALPGLGTYSARAVLCLGYGQPVPMIDEGSGRVLRRVLGFATRGPAYSDPVVLRAAERIVPKDAPKAFNLGLIDIAAAYCHPRAPDCRECPLANVCGYYHVMQPARRRTTLVPCDLNRSE